MDDKCRTCTIKCRQADHIYETALGRMYAMNELLSYVKKIDSGELVEVVRCKDCKQWNCVTKPKMCDKRHGYCLNDDEPIGRWEDDFCSYGERKDNENQN